MTETPFTQFIMLVEIDQSINLLNTTIQKLHAENTQLQSQLKTLADQMEKAKAKLHDVRKEVDMQELEMKRLDQQEAEKKAHLDTISNHKEYLFLKSEIDHLKKKQHVLEDTLVGAWSRLEAVKKEHELTKQTTEQKSEEVQGVVAAHDKKIIELQQEAAQKEIARNEKEQGIPAEWLEKYRIMRTRVTDPVVQVLNGSCSACFYKASPPDMLALERNKLVQCKDCFRLLYLEQQPLPANVQ